MLLYFAVTRVENVQDDRIGFTFLYFTNPSNVPLLHDAILILCFEKDGFVYMCSFHVVIYLQFLSKQ